MTLVWLTASREQARREDCKQVDGSDADGGKEASHAKKTDGVYMLDN